MAKQYKDRKSIEVSPWGKINLYLAMDDKCEVFTENAQTHEEKFLSFYDGLPGDNPDKIIAYIEMKMF